MNTPTTDSTWEVARLGRADRVTSGLDVVEAFDADDELLGYVVVRIVNSLNPRDYAVQSGLFCCRTCAWASTTKENN